MGGAFAAATQRCQACFMRGAGVCRNLSDAQLSALGMANRTVAAGQDLFSQGEPSGEIFSILQGWVFLYELLEDGRRQILEFCLPGDVIGFRPDGRASFFGAQAVGQVELCVIPRQRLMTIAQRCPEFAYQLMCLLAREESQAYERLTAVGRKTAQERVATLLLELFYRLRRRAPLAQGESIKIPLTQTHIADALGLTPVHTNRTLGLLRQQGVIDYANGLFQILIPAKLFAIAGIDAATCPWSAGDDGALPDLDPRSRAFLNVD